MTSKNFTIDNVNPAIQYAPPGAWREGSNSDPLFASYSNGGTFTLCTTQGSSATFTFNGTQVYVFGAKRPNHGPYSITLDGTQTTFDGGSAKDTIPATLFASDPLKLGQHTVTITNQLINNDKPFLDIDFITWTANVPDNGQFKSVEDTDAALSYDPPTSWNTDLAGAQLTGFSSNNGHVTQTTGASVTVSFSGGFISVFGPVGPTIARYSVQVDGIDRGTFNATKDAYSPQVPLYQATGLGGGHHTLQMTAQPAVSGQFMAVDFVQVSPNSTASGGAGGGGGGGGGGNSDNSSSKSSSIGPAVGGAIGGVVVLAILVLLFFFLCRRRKRRQQQDQNSMVLGMEDKYSTATPMVAPVPMAAPYSSSHMSATTPSAYSAPSASQVHMIPNMPTQYGNAPPASPPLTNPYGGIESPPGSQVGWNPAYAASDPNQRRTFHTVNDDPSGGGSGYGYGHASRPSLSESTSVGRSSTIHSVGVAGLGAGGGNAPRRKGAPLPLPPTANMPLPAGAQRMYVEGREQDMGPLPPDYEQATEPYRGRS
ncbi:hypothetical protein R3P38DRAFT_2845138 [Favolaschia claudopus]|uniref:Transmembrane protein n=1 Tax=Favolaschia claudopus TaxID=2862362 RepID=A0AAW0DQU4_9AGAR